ncbi:malate dehydrogenase (quinone) [Paracoccus nototheniae]|uniref:Probable malate:quinone oxidoreductase n=1 Tax=Paracoccus nototheniae TaxID=2489002 RepID=A0ABW4E049_9RHOB|nr:malate dehydrogenase (quinone) [Paracoccus nototheniae]
MTAMTTSTRSDAFRPSRRKVLIGGAALGTLALAGCGRSALPAEGRVDVAIIGGGIMGATLGAMLGQLQPGFRMAMFERLDAPALESSGVWHNAGTGHSALCEPNYTPIRDGRMVIDNAVRINEQFQVTRQFLASMVRLGEMGAPRSFLNSVPHMGFGIGAENVDFQRQRHEALTANPLFAGMEYSADAGRIAEWAPLLTEGREAAQPIAATWHPLGTDANWGEVTRQLVASYIAKDANRLHLNTEVEDIARNADGSWRITFRATNGDTAARAIDATHVFNGAGGAALLMLQKSGIPESRLYGGFPVGGSFLTHEDPAIADRHLSKAYGRAAAGSPPMSVPHLDTRYVDGVRKLAFGPFATFSTNFLMQDSFTGLFRSMNTANLRPMMDVGIDDFGLVTYLAGQVVQTQSSRIDQVREYFPDAPSEGWTLTQAGQRVQIIKRTETGGGSLQFGTELVTSQDGSFVSLLGASPGASTAPSIMLDALQRMFPDRFASAAWQNRLRDLVPSFGTALADDPRQLANAWAYSTEMLALRRPEDLRRDTL